jgi:ubiquinone/menaquinone biosynthesis C-methylase UbiE
MKLLSSRELVRTGPVDHADWNYRPFLGYIQRLRFKLVLDLLPTVRPRRLLEIGYGSGVFLPALVERAEHVLAIDIHPHVAEVTAVLSRRGLAATLMQAPAESIPLGTGFLDCVVAVSALEFVDDLGAVCKEVKRVLCPNGQFVVVTPGHSPIVDAGLKVLTGKSAKHDFADRRALIVPVLMEHFDLVQRREFLRRPLPRLYTAMRLVPK